MLRALPRGRFFSMAFFPTEGRGMAFRSLTELREFVRLAEEPWRVFERQAAGAAGFRHLYHTAVEQDVDVPVAVQWTRSLKV